MNVHTTCPTCNGELTTTYEAAIESQQKHDDCPPPPKSQADKLLENFAALVAKIAAPDYRANVHDGLNLGALQERIDSLDNAPPRLAESAVYYAQHYGWPVFPLRPTDKRPATAHGFKDATTDVDRIKRFWSDNPTCNIGIPTGIAFDVIDIDLPDGPTSWEALRAKPGGPDIHGLVRTSSGGVHVLIAPTGRGNGARIQPGVDYRGNGGYIVAAPSWLGERARSWTWISKPSPAITRRETP